MTDQPHPPIIFARPEVVAYIEQKTGVTVDPDPLQQDRLAQVLVALAAESLRHRDASSVKSFGPDVALSQIGEMLGHRPEPEPEATSAT